MASPVGEWEGEAQADVRCAGGTWSGIGAEKRALCFNILRGSGYA